MVDGLGSARNGLSQIWEKSDQIHCFLIRFYNSFEEGPKPRFLLRCGVLEDVFQIP